MVKTPLLLRICPFSVMIVAKRAGLSTYFVNGGVRLSKPVLQDILQRVRRDGEVGELVDEREDPGAAHGDARDAGVALRLAGLREDLHAVAFGAAVKQTVVEQIVFQVQRRALLGLDIFGVDQTFYFS